MARVEPRLAKQPRQHAHRGRTDGQRDTYRPQNKPPLQIGQVRS